MQVCAQLAGRTGCNLLASRDPVSDMDKRLCSRPCALPQCKRDRVRSCPLDAVNMDSGVCSNPGTHSDPRRRRQPAAALGTRLPMLSFGALIADPILGQALLDQTVDTARLKLHWAGYCLANSAFAA